MWQAYSVLFSAVLGFVLAKWGFEISTPPIFFFFTKNSEKIDLGFNPKCLKNTGFNHHYSITIITWSLTRENGSFRGELGWGWLRFVWFFLLPFLRCIQQIILLKKINNWKYFIWAKSYKNECQWIIQINYTGILFH